MAVPPNLVGFAESVGLFKVTAYGPDPQKQMEAEIVQDWYKLRNPFTVIRQARNHVSAGWSHMSKTLTKMAAGVDVILTGTTYQEVAANVAESQGVPLAALHYFPMRANNHVLPVQLPRPLVEAIWSAGEWAHWRLLKLAYDAQRRTLGLPESKIRATRRIVEGGALEIQAFDKVFFPGLEEQWGNKRPVVGGITLELATAADQSVMSWIAAGRPPIYFGFGSMPLDDPAETIGMILKVCRELGERALIYKGSLALEGRDLTNDVMLAPSFNHAEIFPLCRAIVHHGGAGTTAASLRSGVPTLVLWVSADQPIWARQVKRLGVGSARRLSATNPKTLHADLRAVLRPGCATRAREVADQMTPPGQSLAATADLLESLAASQASR